eukprot:c40673_g1_i1 orf=2-274(-)
MEEPSSTGDESACSRREKQSRPKKKRTRKRMAKSLLLPTDSQPAFKRSPWADWQGTRRAKSSQSRGGRGSNKQGGAGDASDRNRQEAEGLL